MEMTHPSAMIVPAGAELAAVSAGRMSSAGRGTSELLPGVSMRLADLATGAAARVISVSSSMDAHGSELSRRLAELGFLPGEKLRVVARGLMGREPIAVRIGTGTFALRLFEAACVRVCPEQPLPR